MVSLEWIQGVSAVLAQVGSDAAVSAETVGESGLLIRHLLAAIVFSLVGVAVLGLCFWLMHRFCPFPLVKEIEEDQNTAVAIVMAAVILGISLIISAAIQG